MKDEISLADGERITSDILNYNIKLDLLDVTPRGYKVPLAKLIVGATRRLTLEPRASNLSIDLQYAPGVRYQLKIPYNDQEVGLLFQSIKE